MMFDMLPRLRPSGPCGLLVAAFLTMFSFSASTAHAEFLIPDSSTPPFGDWTRGDANSLYAEWDVFTVAVGAPGNSPDVGALPAAGTPDGNDALLVGNNATGFLAGGGNIYSFAEATDFSVSIPGYGNGAGWNSRYVVQVQSIGTSLDLDSVILSYNDGVNDIPLDWDYYDELSSVDFGGGQGFQIDHLFVFDLPGVNPAETSVDFASLGSSMSLSRVMVDTFTSQAPFSAAPEPSSVALSMVGLVGIGLFARRRKRSEA